MGQNVIRYIQFSVSIELHRKIRIICAELGISISEFMRSNVMENLPPMEPEAYRSLGEGVYGAEGVQGTYDKK